MRRYRIHHEGSRDSAPLTEWMLAWRQAELALALALVVDDLPRAAISRALARLALARTLEGREN